MIWIASTTLVIARPCCQNISSVLPDIHNSYTGKTLIHNFTNDNQIHIKTIPRHSVCEQMRRGQIQLVVLPGLSTAKSLPVFASFPINRNIPLINEFSPYYFHHSLLLTSNPYLATKRLRI